MKIAVVGPGALGCLVAGYLKTKTKEDIWLLDKPGARAGILKEKGLKVEGAGSSFTAHPDVTSSAAEIGQCDLIVICVKSYSTEDVCKEIKPLVGEATHVLTLQNGIGNVQTLNDHFGQGRIIAGVTNHGATLIGPGHVRHAGKGETVIGKSGGRLLGAIKEVSAVLNKAGFETRISRDIDSVIWSKLIINVGINALSAVTRLKNGDLIEHEGSRSVLRNAVQEAVKVVKRKRIKLSYDDPIQKVESVCKATGANVSIQPLYRDWETSGIS